MDGVSRILNSFGIAPTSPILTKPNAWLSQRKNDRLLFAKYPRRFFSQFGEDAILQAMLPIKVGTYVDIGSGHPVAGSNTYALYELGWRGILIDPIRTNVELSKRLRPGDICIQAAIGREGGSAIDFFEFDVYEYSTTSRERVSELEAMGHSLRASYPVEMRSLREVLCDFTPKSISVLSLDVEGGEMDVLRGNDWKSFRPTFIIVEEWEPPLGIRTEAFHFLSDLGYSLTAVAGVSSIYRLIEGTD